MKKQDLVEELLGTRGRREFEEAQERDGPAVTADDVLCRVPAASIDVVCEVDPIVKTTFSPV